uniref:Uncharacterized protein n=1 Tax=Timema tahoe TaxID=61484 RepID=A0A7R9IA19_9NEOP|nr:unnamed protein product [Timema tahoe]
MTKKSGENVVFKPIPGASPELILLDENEKWAAQNVLGGPQVARGLDIPDLDLTETLKEHLTTVQFKIPSDNAAICDSVVGIMCDSVQFNNCANGSIMPTTESQMAALSDGS